MGPAASLGGVSRTAMLAGVYGFDSPSSPPSQLSRLVMRLQKSSYAAVVPDDADSDTTPLGSGPVRSWVTPSILIWM
jgi:hypothetical protein